MDQIAPATTAAAETPRSDRAVFEALRRRIITHEIPPGTPLREQALSDEFGISRARIREIFAGLEQRGLVERSANRGATVRRATAPELLQALDVREMLEGLAVRLATQNTAPEAWQPLVEVFGSPLAQALERGDVAEYLRHHDDLRRSVLAAAANEALRQALRPLYDRTVVLMRRLVLTTAYAQEALLHHRGTLEAMRRGDAVQAEQRRRAQIRAVKAALERYHAYLL